MPKCRNEQSIAADLKLTIVSGESPYTGWEEGTVYAGSMKDTVEFDNQNENAWGEEVDSDLVVSNFGCVFKLVETGDPDKRLIDVTSLFMTVGSFDHELLSPTGVNAYDLQDGFASFGQVDVTTGEVEFLKIHAAMTNDYFKADDPALFLFDMTGSLDPDNLEAYLVVDGLAYEFKEE